MDKRMYIIGWLALTGCSAPAAAALHAPVRVATATEPARHASRPTAALVYDEGSARDQAFLDNAERAIREYHEFIARAGNDDQFAPAVKRSREQVEDLQAEIEFVRAGMRERASR